MQSIVDLVDFFRYNTSKLQCINEERESTRNILAAQNSEKWARVDGDWIRVDD
jgi:hypothetical protein